MFLTGGDEAGIIDRTDPVLTRSSVGDRKVRGHRISVMRELLLDLDRNVLLERDLIFLSPILRHLLEPLLPFPGAPSLQQHFRKPEHYFVRYSDRAM